MNIVYLHIARFFSLIRLISAFITFFIGCSSFHFFQEKIWIGAFYTAIVILTKFDTTFAYMSYKKSYIPTISILADKAFYLSGLTILAWHNIIGLGFPYFFFVRDLVVSVIHQYAKEHNVKLEFENDILTNAYVTLVFGVIFVCFLKPSFYPEKISNTLFIALCFSFKSAVQYCKDLQEALK